MDKEHSFYDKVMDGLERVGPSYKVTGESRAANTGWPPFFVCCCPEVPPRATEPGSIHSGNCGWR